MADEKATTTADEGKATTANAVATKRKKSKIKVTRGKIFIQSSYNNTIITVTDINGNVIGWGSAGRTGFKGSKKSTPYAAQKTMEDTVQRLKDTGLKEVDVFVNGIGTGRESAVRALQSSGFEILTIKDQTPTPHGGVRPKKARRV
jgi:small subunit ribosomal protein S11